MSPNPITSVRSLLARLGLDEKEREVYLALLSLKLARVTQVAKASKQSRSHTYLVLRSLEEKGLVSEVQRGAVIHFLAEPPEKLLTYVQDRERELKETEQLLQGALPLLKQIEKPLPGEPRVTKLHGLDGMKQVYRDLLTQEFTAFFNAEKMFEAFGSNVVHQLFGKDAKLRGRELFVDNEAARRYLEEIPTDEEYQIRLLPKGMMFDAEAIIYNDVVALFAYDDEKTIIRIENRNIAQSFKAWFEAMWNMAEPAKN